MPTRRIEINEAVTIKPVVRERNGRFEPVPGQFAYYTASGTPLRQNGEVITVQSGDTLVLPANHNIATLDLRYRNTSDQLVVPERNAPAIAVENRGPTLRVAGNSDKLILAGGNFSMQMLPAQLAGIQAPNAGGVVGSTSTIEQRNGGYRLNTGTAGSLTVMPNTRLDIQTPGVGRSNTLLAIDGSEDIARVRARHADMLRNAKNAAVNGNARLRASPTENINPEFTVANTPAAPAANTRTFPDNRNDIRPDAATAPGTQPNMGQTRPNTPPERRGGGAPAPADPRREAARGIATDLQTIITARGTGAGETAEGRLGYFQDRNTNRNIGNAYNAIVEAQRQAEAIASGQANTPEARRNFNTALNRAVETMQTAENSATRDNIRNVAREIRERIERLRERARTGNLTSMNIDGAVSPTAVAMLNGNQQAPQQPTAENAMSPEALALLTGTESNRGNLEDIPTRPQGTTRQV